ncbi:heavy metal translocating P-type ATPase [Candidatus Pacearchaeota archaeon]|nr:heavy metal translocating P-type ATPase [Candidatus Pacearchaeota archaeon]
MINNNSIPSSHKIITFVKNYPIPVFAIIGLLAGSILQWTPNQHESGHWVWFVTLVAGGAPIIWQTVRGMLHRHFASDIVALLAIVTAILLNDAFPGLVIVLMQSGGKALEDHAFKKASSSLDTLLSRSPQLAHRKKDHGLEEINVTDVRIGDLFLVRPGDLIPVDGEITNEQAEIDESALTGEPLPKIKKIGEQVFSGTINVGNAFEMRADKISGESQYAKIVQLVRKAQQEKAPIQRLADRYAVWFTPITIGISGLGWLLTHNVETILSVLVVATPCSLIFATPVAIISGINKAAKSGIIIKTGSAIEQVGKAHVVVFDKTGTITFGIPIVEKVISTNKINADDLLCKAASVEQLSSHPTASVLVKKGQEMFGKLPIPKNFHELAGAGVDGDVEGDHIVVGSQSVFENFVDTGFAEYIREVKKQINAEGKMLAFVGINNKPAGVIVFGDEIRSDVNSMVEYIKKLGVKKTIMLTGDNLDNAKSIAQQAGITDLEANLLPEQKVIAVKKLKQEFENVIMVGDGINDAPALAASTVGVAMGAHGTAISAEAADMVLLVDDISKVSKVIEIGQKTIRIAKQSIFVGLGLSFVFMAIASLGYIPPAIGALLQEVLDVSVILNALRAR